MVGWGVPLAEHLTNTSEPIMLSWLSGSNSHSGGSGNGTVSLILSIWRASIEERQYKERTESQEQLRCICHSIEEPCYNNSYIHKSANDRRFETQRLFSIFLPTVIVGGLYSRCVKVFIKYYSVRTNVIYIETDDTFSAQRGSQKQFKWA